MLKKLHISEFKTIVDAHLDFGKVNLFIGANGSGKSNILEAIGVLSAALGRDITDVELQKKGVRLSVPLLFKSAFKNRTLRASFALEAEFNSDVTYDVRITAGEQSDALRFFTEHVRHKGIKYLGRSNHGISVSGFSAKKDISKERGIWDRFHEVVDAPEVVHQQLREMERYCIYAPQTSFLRGSDIEAIPVKPMGLCGSGLPQAAAFVLKLFNASKGSKRQLTENILRLVWMPGWADTITIDKFNPELVSSRVITGESTLYFHDRFMRQGRNVLSAYDGSEGSLYLLFIAVLALHPEAPRIFALDNIDNALNPLATRTLLETLIDTTCAAEYHQHEIGPEQVFLTSHNPTALDAFDLFNDDQRIFVVKRNQSGYTEITRLKPSPNMTREDWIRIKKGKNLSEMLISNMIPDALGSGVI